MITKKKLIIMLTMMFLVFLTLGLNNYCMAASFSTSASNTSLTVGGTTTLTINTEDCYGQFTITSSDSSVVSVSKSKIWSEDEKTVTLTAVKEGKATITVTATNVTDTAGDNDITGSKTVTINVSAASSNNSSSNNSSNTSSKSSDATLKSLTVGGKTYSNPNTDITVSSVSASTSSITISATANSSAATISGTGTKDLVTGTNKFTITVKAENGDTKSYVVRVSRLAEESSTPNVVEETTPEEETTEEEQVQELRLTTLVVNGTDLYPEFSSEVFEYNIYVVDVDEVQIDAIANMEEANVEITGNTELIEGENTATIKLTKDDQTTEYVIKINKTISLVEEAEVDDEEKIGIIGMITNWWNTSGPVMVLFAVVLILLGASIIFAITSYKYGNNAREVSKHSKVDFIKNEDLIDKNE